MLQILYAMRARYQDLVRSWATGYMKRAFVPDSSLTPRQRENRRLRLEAMESEFRGNLPEHIVISILTLLAFGSLIADIDVKTESVVVTGYQMVLGLACFAAAGTLNALVVHWFNRGLWTNS